MNMEHTHGVHSAIVHWELNSHAEKVGITCAPLYHKRERLQLHHSTPLKHSAQLTEALVCLNTNTKGWTAEHVLVLMVHVWLGKLHQLRFTTFNQISSSVEVTEAFCICLSTLITILNSRINLWWETGMNINMLKNDSPSKNSTCLSVSIQRCNSCSQYPLSHFPACPQKKV